MSSRRPIRVYPDGNGWVVKQDGKERAAAVKRTKREALEKARDLAYNQDLTVVVHGSDGKIQRTFRTADRDGGGDCFLTTACTRYYGLSDDCYQLTILRHFRDGHLLQSKHGAALVQQYYAEAPRLVAKLKVRKDKSLLYAEIFRRIGLACDAVENGQMRSATQLYVDAMLWLRDRLA